MASLKDVKMKIGGVAKTKQITKAMNMVSSAKLRGAQARIERFRPYAEKFQSLLADLSEKAEDSAHPLLDVHAEKKTCTIILVTSDRGLCGSFNGNLISQGLKLAKQKAGEGMEIKFICMGKKGRDAVAKTDYETVLSYGDRMGSIDFTLAGKIGNEVIHSYEAFDTDEVYLIFGEFHSLAKQVPVVQSLLPIVNPKAEFSAVTDNVDKAEKAENANNATQGQNPHQQYLYEPEEEKLLAELLPSYVRVQVYRGLLDTSASEHAARMAAMDNATRNCDDMTRLLTLLYNKTRQASITSDLMDIVSGAEALNG